MGSVAYFSRAVYSIGATAKKCVSLQNNGIEHQFSEFAA